MIAALLTPVLAEDGGPRAGQAIRSLGPSVFLGMRNLHDQRPDQALETFMAMLEDNPDSPRLHLFIGEAHLELNECEKGEEWMIPHRTRPAFQFEYAGKLAGCYARRRDFSAAEYWQEDAVNLDANNPVQWTRLALYRHRMGDVERSAEAMAVAEELDPDHMSVHYTRGLIAAAEGRLDDVETELPILREMPRGKHSALVLEARLELDLGNAFAAERIAKEANRLDMNNQAAILVRGEATRILGDPHTARNLLQRRRQVIDERPRMWPSLVRTLVDLGLMDDAIALLETAQALDPADADTLASAWYVARVQGDAEAMAHHAAIYAAVQTNPHRSLERLVPYTETSP
ncbi:MAG: hypothetical protein GY913_15890 [Proteobacteria bacterium]|nr:hypothetical protein [Pseudomonadota bacterium]